MPQQLFRTAMVLTLLLLFIPRAWLIAGQKKPDQAVGEETARDALVKFNKDWKGYTNEPNRGDPRWKLKMETLVRLAQAGPAAIPLLEEAAKKDSNWTLATRELADETLGLLRKSELRKTLADYDLTKMDSARIGKLAPDFALKDATGERYVLSQFRDKKIVVLAFVLADT